MHKIVCLTGPSGVGKTSYAKRLCHMKGFSVPRVATTRQRRADDGPQYVYVCRDVFLRMVGDSTFIEHDAYLSYYYGTFREDVISPIIGSQAVVLDLTPRGVEQVVRVIPDAIVIVIQPDDPTWLLTRLRERGTQEESEILDRQKNLIEFLKQLDRLPGTRVSASYSPSSWDQTFQEILDSIGVVTY